MPPKRPHKKSRYGCDQCRKRRVKCDEEKPRCTNCNTRGEECRFPLPPLQHGRRSPSNHSAFDNRGDRSSAHSSPGESIFNCASLDLYPVQSSTILTPPKPFQRGPPPMTDLALMHHWCTRTCYSFTPRGMDLFRDHVGQEAIRHSYLMEALLALTLLHIASEMDDKTAARPYVSAALQHQNRSLSGLGAILSDISPENCDAIFASSTLIMVCAIVSPLLPTDGDHAAKSSAETMLLLVDLLNGIASIVQLSRKWLVKGPLSAILSPGLTKGGRPDDWSPTEDLRNLTNLVENLGSRNHEVFARAIHGLEISGKRETSVITWVLFVGSEFMNELRSGDLAAFTIFMYWGVLLYQTDDMWWTRYSGSRLVEELSSTLVGRGEEWEMMAAVCRQRVGLPT